MNATSPEPFLVREKSIADLKRFSLALVELTTRCGGAKDKLAKSLAAAMSAKCVRCGTQVAGEELLALAAEDDKAPPNLLRLRENHCAREDCASDTYCLTLQRHPGLDWTLLLLQVERIQEEQARQAAIQRESTRLAERAAHRGRTLRIALLVALGILLFLIRQWYLGGRIPLLREPERFHVDPLPPGAVEAR